MLRSAAEVPPRRRSASWLGGRRHRRGSEQSRHADLGLRILQPPRSAVFEQLESKVPLKHRALLERGSVSRRRVLRFAGHIDRGEEDLLRDDSGGDEDRATENLNLVWGDLDSGLLAYLDRRPDAQTLLALVRNLQNTGDDFLDPKMGLRVGDGWLLFPSKIRRRAQILPGENLEPGAAPAIDHHCHRIQLRAIDDVDPVDGRSRAIAAAVATSKPTQLQKALIPSRGRRAIFDDLDVHHGRFALVLQSPLNNRSRPSSGGIPPSQADPWSVAGGHPHDLLERGQTMSEPEDSGFAKAAHSRLASQFPELGELEAAVYQIADLGSDVQDLENAGSAEVPRLPTTGAAGAAHQADAAGKEGNGNLQRCKLVRGERGLGRAVGAKSPQKPLRHHPQQARSEKKRGHSEVL